MGVRRISASSRHQMLELCVAAAKAAAQQYGSVDVIVASSGDAELLKLALCEESVLGIGVQTLSQLIESQWELLGDGRTLASDTQRHILLRPVLAEVAGLEPSASYVTQFASFMQDSIACVVPLDEPVLASARERYLSELEDRGLVDPASAARILSNDCASKAVVAVCPDEGRPFVRACLEALGCGADVTVIQRCLPCELGASDAAGEGELGQLRQQLFTGRGGLKSEGVFTALEVHGTHAETAAVVKLVRRALEVGKTPSQIAVALPRANTVCPMAVQALAQTGIPASSQYSLPFGQTAFGAAFLQLERMLSSDDDGWENAAAFLSSPFSGVQDKDARAFAQMWRAQNGGTKEERLEMLTRGLKKRVPAKLWAEKLEGIRALLEASDMEDRVRLMFENGKKAAFDLERMADDVAAANKLLGYLECCELLGHRPHEKDMSALEVLLTCAYAPNEGEAVQVCAASQLPLLEGVEHVIFARLDKDEYPMAAKPAPFDRYLLAGGREVVLNTALKNRLLLLDALEAADSFACYRFMSNAEGSECCQSALWDELMAVYRSEADAGQPAHALPLELLGSGCGLRMAEADVFHEGRQGVERLFDVKRGEVDEAALELLFPDAERFNESFSPTAIEDYYRCPYRWLICRRIGANSIDKSFDQIAKGNLAHSVLERLYVNMREAGIPRVTPENLSRCLAMADEAFEWQRQHDVDKRELVLRSSREWEESEFVRRQVKELVCRDAAFLPGFAPMYLELKLETPDGAPLTYAGVPVRGKVDRIDVDERGRAVVIDYKLSSLGSGYGLPKDGGMPTRIQTDIYALLVQRCLEMQGVDIKVVGSVYRSYAKNNLRGAFAQGINWGPVEKVRLDLDALPGGACLDSYETYLEHVEEKVSSLLECMRNGDVRPDPLCADACEHCLAQGFCHERRG